MLAMLLAISVFFIIPGSFTAFGIELFSKDDNPFGIAQDVWMQKYWNWWISLSTEETTPIKDGCLINKNDSVVFVIEPTIGIVPNQICDISSKQGILIPLWPGWCDSGTDKDYQIAYPEKTWADCARERYNTGHIRAEAMVDGRSIAKMDVKLSPSLVGGVLGYTITSLENVTEIYGNEFNLIIPEDSHKNAIPGTHVAGWHGWVIFLEPLPPGKHILSYSNKVSGPNANKAEVTYILNVK
jgi:hypothetical protein